MVSAASDNGAASAVLVGEGAGGAAAEPTSHTVEAAAEEPLSRRAFLGIFLADDQRTLWRGPPSEATIDCVL